MYIYIYAMAFSASVDKQRINPIVWFVIIDQPGSTLLELVLFTVCRFSNAHTHTNYLAIFDERFTVTFLIENHYFPNLLSNEMALRHQVTDVRHIKDPSKIRTATLRT